MSRSTKELTGAGKERFLRNLFHNEANVSGLLAEQLTKITAEQITTMRVLRSALNAHGRSADKRDDEPIASLVGAPAETTDAIGDDTAPVAPAFDPFAFNTITLYRREGRGALLARLQTIQDASHLIQIADAQRLSVDEQIRDNGSVPELIDAIVSGVEQWIANRRAAAS